jgi:hypothetical protein
MEHLEISKDAFDLTMHKIAFTTKNYQVQNANSAEVKTLL